MSADAGWADQRVEAAREFLEHARRHQVTELPPSVLVRELAEARRVIGELLAFAEDYKDDEAAADPDVSRVALDGGVYLSPADARALDELLAGAPGGRYREIARRLGIGEGR